ncbi:type I-E CRISPR-associated protein Cse1/CasA [Nocardiopsis sp. CT-R113]|uniref:Type I-E CRISPR-associated protein Cse1/CasA n=1 Tax=Nocardiopsis codii TaxID=3065942 RepID=A0ABU7K760_9ACTN|nr:type I-E CRISPR-associated protein Cse1/CasA [Nocardiopsis sp. CT-R113]MEE2038068.1 type I-E CRISPR-associated protein Cse1/CasA [Nocardiopsis sp. CT-R113]
MPTDASGPASPPPPHASPPTHPPSFDLTSRPWLPVQRLDGTEAELSLTEVFEQASHLRRLVGDVPTQDFVLLRLLLAVLHDALDGPEEIEDWAELWNDGDGDLPADRVRGYLDEHRDRFDLLHPSTPFLQVPDLHTAKGEHSSLDPIVADVPNNARFFTMRAHGAERLGFAEAARWLLHAHAYDTSGIKSGVVGDPRVKGGKVYPQGVGWAGNLGGVYVEGDDLRATLLLNLLPRDTDNLRSRTDDRPAWRHEPATAEALGGAEAQTRPHGLRDLYTWQSRRVRLHHDGDAVHGVLLAYGDPLTPRNKHDREPMTAWRRSPAQEKKIGEEQVYLPRDHDPARSAWRGLGALVTGHVRGAEQRREAAKIVRPRVLDWIARLTVEGYLDGGLLIRTRLVGAVYGTQQSVIDEIVDDTVAMPVVLLHEEDSTLGQTAVDAVNDAEGAVMVLGDLATALAEAAGAESEAPRATARDRGFAALDETFRKWLRDLRPSDDPLYPGEQRSRWQLTAREIVSGIGDDLLDSASEAAWTGRVVAAKNGPVWLTASRADLRFRSGLRRALPMATPDDPEAPQ